jgi:hypothetical protein
VAMWCVTERSRMSEKWKNGKMENLKKIYSGEIPRINFSIFPFFHFFLNGSFGLQSYPKFLNRIRDANPLAYSLGEP